MKFLLVNLIIATSVQIKTRLCDINEAFIENSDLHKHIPLCGKTLNQFFMTSSSTFQDFIAKCKLDELVSKVTLFLSDIIHAKIENNFSYIKIKDTTFIIATAHLEATVMQILKNAIEGNVLVTFTVDTEIKDVYNILWVLKSIYG